MESQRVFYRLWRHKKFVGLVLAMTGVSVAFVSIVHTETLRNLIYGEEVFPDPDWRVMFSDTWIRVEGRNDTYVFSAFYTGRDKHVRVLGIGPTNLRTVQCGFLCLMRHQDVPSYSTGHVIQMGDSHGQRYNNIEIECPLPVGCYSESVSVSQTTYNKEVFLQIHHPPEPGVHKKNLSVCLPVIHPKSGRFTEIVQSFELDTLLGAESFTAYYQSSSPEVDNVLRMYVDTGKVALHKWNLPHVDVHALALLTSIRDCFYRNMHTSNYIVFKDFHEVLLPYKHKNWLALLDHVRKQDHKVAAFIFRNSFINENDPDVTDGMQADEYKAIKQFVLTVLLKQSRQTDIWASNLRSKFIVDPQGVDNVEIHTVKQLRAGFKIVVVNETDGLLFHYTKSGDRDAPRKRDAALLRFKSRLLERVSQIYVTLAKHYDIQENSLYNEM